VTRSPSKKLDSVFSALADPTRRAILLNLKKKDFTVTEIAKPFSISLPAVSKHLKVLEKANLVLRHKHGREYRFRVNLKPIDEAITFLKYYERFWTDQFDRLDIFIQKTKKEGN
jgi:DNA-binding transcriptional ArsR family regulator